MKHFILIFTLSVLTNAYFDIEYHKFEQKVGDRDHFADISKIKIRKINGTKDRGLFGPVIVHGSIDDSFLWHTSLYVKQGGEYRLHPFKIPTEEFCKGINNDLHFVPGVAEKSNLTLPMPCPIINTTYIVDGYRAKIPQGLMVAFQSGDYAGRTYLTKNGDIVLDIWGYVSVVKI